MVNVQRAANDQEVLSRQACEAVRYLKCFSKNFVLCNVHISSRPLNKQQEQITLPERVNSNFIF